MQNWNTTFHIGAEVCMVREELFGHRKRSLAAIAVLMEHYPYVYGFTGIDSNPLTSLKDVVPMIV